MSNRTMSPSSRMAARWASVPPIIPAPISAIFLRAMAGFVLSVVPGPASGPGFGGRSRPGGGWVNRQSGACGQMNAATRYRGKRAYRERSLFGDPLILSRRNPCGILLMLAGASLLIGAVPAIAKPHDNGHGNYKVHVMGNGYVDIDRNGIPITARTTSTATTASTTASKRAGAMATTGVPRAWPRRTTAACPRAR